VKEVAGAEAAASESHDGLTSARKKGRTGKARVRSLATVSSEAATATDATDATVATVAAASGGGLHASDAKTEC